MGVKGGKAPKPSPRVRALAAEALAGAINLRIEALEGVLRQIRTEAGKRAETTVTPEKERWEWVVRGCTSALEGKA